MKAILTRQSGVTAKIDVYPTRRDVSIETLESAILDTFNSFEGTKSDPFHFCRNNKEAKALECKMKNKL